MFFLLLKRLLFIGTCLYVLVYLFAALTPYISPLHSKYFTYLALLFPLLLVGMMLLFILNFLFLKRKALVFLLVILFGYKNILSTTGFHANKAFVYQHQDKKTLRVLSWNVQNFINCHEHYDTPNAPRRLIFNFIKECDADVLCFQDFQEYDEKRPFYSNIKYIKDTLHYPFYYFSVDDDDRSSPYFKSYYGTIIFSRYPLLDTGKIAYIRKHAPEHLMYGTITINNKPVRIYNTHLRSMYLSQFGIPQADNVWYRQDDTAVIYHEGRLRKLQYFDSTHVGQAYLVKEQLNKTKLPFIFCADLNSVPSSFVYQHISHSLNDAFLMTSGGWGGTYTKLSPTLRIDVVLTSPELTPTQYYSPRLFASDHFPVLTDIVVQ